MLRKEEGSQSRRSPAPSRYDKLLAEAGKIVGAQDINVSKLKTILREQGDVGQKLAARVGRLSKCRNGAAHTHALLEEQVFGCLHAAGHVTEPGSSEDVDASTMFEVRTRPVYRVVCTVHIYSTVVYR